MGFAENERLVFEAITRRKNIAEGSHKGFITEKGIREIAALFALRDSFIRGEQPEGIPLDLITDCQLLARDVDKLIPKIEGQ
ncbi:hypothetical protein BH10PAT3_BH10PAT3_4190 [soil metagenome]